MTLLITLFYIVFVLAAIVLVVVVLLQEGRGGGFGEALGSHGRETFGVGSRGINTFTAVTAGVFLGCALLIHILNQMEGKGDAFGRDGAPPAESPFAAPGQAPFQVPAPPPGENR